MLRLDVRTLALSIPYSFQRVHCSLVVGVFLARPPSDYEDTQRIL